MTEPHKKITYSTEFFFDNLDCQLRPDIQIDEQYNIQYEYLEFPVDWTNPNNQKYSMRVYHSSKDYLKAKNVFIFINGGPGETVEQALGDKITNAVGEGWDVILFDQRGCGMSQHTTNDQLIDFKYLTIDQTVEDVHALVKLSRKRNHSKVIVAGGSTGAFIALRYGILYSDTIELLYIDAGAASADFINLSAGLAVETISKALHPEKLEDIADYFGIDESVLFTYLMEQGQRDPEFKRSLWNNFKVRNDAAKTMLNEYIENNILIPPFDNARGKLNRLMNSGRLYYIMGCMEVIPKKQDLQKYDYFKPYNMIIPELISKYNLKWNPFDFTTSLSRIDTKTIVTNGLNDFIVPFESIKRMYKHMNQENTILVGFKNTGHVALASDNFSFIIEMIEIYLNSSSKQNVTEFVMKNDQAMIF